MANKQNKTAVAAVKSANKNEKVKMIFMLSKRFQKTVFKMKWIMIYIS